MNEIKYINIKEFVEKGFLQEINRRILHRAGLALEVSIDDNGVYSLKGVIDWNKVKMADDEIKRHDKARVEILDGSIQIE